MKPAVWMVCLLFGSRLWAAQGAVFVQIAPDARGAALAGSGAVLLDGAAAMAYNPAGLAAQGRGQVAVSTVQWIEGTRLNSLAVGTAVGDRSLNLGMHVAILDSGDIAVVGETPDGNPDLYSAGIFHVRETAVRLGGALRQKIGNSRAVDIGANLVLVRRDLYLDTAAGWAFDFGLRFGETGEGFQLGLALQQVGPPIGTDDSPALVRLGGKANLATLRPGDLSIAGEVAWPLDSEPRASIGLEWWLGGHLALRAGRAFLTDLESWSAGLGFKLPVKLIRPSLDYAFQPLADFKAIHRWSLNAEF